MFPVGLIGGVHGRKIVAFMVGVVMTGSEKSASESISKSLVKVCCIGSHCLFIGPYIALGKRIEAQKAEAEFLILLRENAKVMQGGSWKTVSCVNNLCRPTSHCKDLRSRFKYQRIPDMTQSAHQVFGRNSTVLF